MCILFSLFDKVKFSLNWTKEGAMHEQYKAPLWATLIEYNRAPFKHPNMKLQISKWRRWAALRKWRETILSMSPFSVKWWSLKIHLFLSKHKFQHTVKDSHFQSLNPHYEKPDPLDWLHSQTRLERSRQDPAHIKFIYASPLDINRILSMQEEVIRRLLFLKA